MLQHCYVATVEMAIGGKGEETETEVVMYTMVMVSVLVPSVQSVRIT